MPAPLYSLATFIERRDASVGVPRIDTPNRLIRCLRSRNHAPWKWPSSTADRGAAGWPLRSTAPLDGRRSAVSWQRGRREATGRPYDGTSAGPWLFSRFFIKSAISERHDRFSGLPARLGNRLSRCGVNRKTIDLAELYWLRALLFVPRGEALGSRARWWRKVRQAGERRSGDPYRFVRQ